MNAKDIVLKFVRDANPQTMELKEGLRFKWNYDVYTVNCGGTCFPRQHILAFSCTADCHNFADDPSDRQKEFRKYFSCPKEWWEENRDYIEILGSDMGFAELIIAINKIPQHHGELEWDDGEIVFRIYRDDADGISHYVVFEHLFDITKNLHNQPEPFYQVLLPLIPNA